ncbi:DEAD/DEAH box helicase [Pseudoclavibacter sp. CFCC 11306]|uniref:DEAD/DEAH box helicase n=1 Tax=Pseudoclavibacter sp. CFCC 11306 TaxID=1564493 RepID=UPI0013010338|nr:DEAD/DEAH box helicase [Pseudoclavibacter sp. CFCC 11306]KAB1658159.1 DEAD/DEAH box helicase [Pseudoclavibacter sp. CFCC 11306]
MEAPRLKIPLPGIEARPYQVEAWQRLRNVRDQGQRSGLVHMATGLGKTIVAAGDIAQFIEERRRAGDPPPHILFLAHQRELLAQARSELSTLLPGINYSGLGGQDQRRWKSPRLTFATLQSMVNRLKQLNASHYDYIVVDESHHSAAPHFNRVIRHFSPAFLLGITATPFRRDQADLAETFGPTIFSMSLADAIAAGWLMSPDYRLYRDEVINDIIGQDFLSVSSLNHALFSHTRNDQIATLIMDTERAMPGKPRTIVFTRSIAAAEHFGAYLPHARVLHSGLPRARQREIISGFRNGRIPAVVTVDMFNEGVDIPEASLIVFLRSTASRTIFEQQLGRGLRKTAGKQQVTIMDFVGTSERLHDLYHLRRSVKTAGNTLRRAGISDADIQEFDVHFTRQDMAIIQRLHELQTPLPAAPPGYQHLSELATILGHSTQVLKQACQDLDIPLVKMRRRHGREGYYFSPDQIEHLKQHLPQTQSNTRQMLSTIREFSRSSGFGPTLIRTAMKELGLTGTRIRSQGVAHGATALTTDEQEQIINHVHISTEGAKTIKELARSLNTSIATITGTMSELQITATPAYGRTSHVRGHYVQPADVNRISEHLKDTSTGQSAADIAKAYGVSLSTVHRAIRRAGITGTKRRTMDLSRAERVFDTDEVGLIARSLKESTRLNSSETNS